MSFDSRENGVMAGWDINRGLSFIPQQMRMRLAMGLAIAADLVQIVGFPVFAEGAASPVDDVVDLVMAVSLGLLLGWHWEFAPSFAAKLIPGVDLVPLWSLAVGNVWRKTKKEPVASEPVTIEGTVERGDLPKR
jgi:hypothetical protein